jgi:hypothetical protein
VLVHFPILAIHPWPAAGRLGLSFSFLMDIAVLYSLYNMKLYGIFQRNSSECLEKNYHGLAAAGWSGPQGYPLTNLW